jgi:hypothetical protein
MQTFEEVFAQIKPLLEPLEKLRKDGLFKVRICTFSWFSLLILFYFLVITTTTEALFILNVILLIICGYIALRIGQTAIKKYKDNFKDIVIKALINAIDPQLSYSKESYVSEETYHESKIFLTNLDKYYGDDYVWGMVDKTMVEFSQLLTGYEVHTSKGGTQFHIVFDGLFMVSDFNKNFKCSVFILPDFSEKIFGNIAKLFQKMNTERPPLIYMEDPEFEKLFKVYSNDTIEARYILSIDMLKRIVEVKNKLRKTIYLSFVNSKMFLAISSDQDIFNPKMSRSVFDPGMICEFYNNILSCVQIVDEMNLNTRIWTKC